MEKKNLPYPDNLLADIFGDDFKTGKILSEKPYDFDATLDYVLGSCLSERGQKVIRMRYQKGMGYGDIAAILHMDSKNVHNAIQQPIRRLQHERIKQMLQNGISHFIESIRREDLNYHIKLVRESAVLDNEEKELVTQILKRKRVSVTHLDAVDIEKLDLSVRTYQLLKRGNINTVKDLIEEGSEKLLKLRNMGPRSMEEIRQAVKAQFGYIID